MLTFERASELLRYDEETGKIYWKVTRGGVEAGVEAGTLRREGRNTYRQIRIDGQSYLAHRIAWLLFYEVRPVNGIDHHNGNGLDNRPANMREATASENAKNQRMRSVNTSGHVGVSWYTPSGKWRAYIRINGKKKHLGYFTDKDEATAVYRKAAAVYGYTERHGVAF